MFETLKDFLNINFSYDYWSDEAINQAYSIVNSFNEQDMANLEDYLRVEIGSIQSIWLIRCA